MRAAKVVFFAIALVAMIGSMGSVLAQTREPFQQDPDPGGSGGGSGSWHVTCQYNEFEQLISKTCTSGGTHACSCP
jgi:invasion protein IalB